MTRARTLADMISDGVIGTTELADDAITPVKLDETGSYAMAGLTVDTNTLHVDSANNRVGIGTTSPASQAHLYNASASATFRIETDADAYASISFLNDLSNWGVGVDNADHFYVYDSVNASNIMEFGNNDIVFNQTGKDYDFRVESDSNTHMLFVDAGNNYVGFGKSTLSGGSGSNIVDGIVQINCNASETALRITRNGVDFGGYNINFGADNISGGVDYYDFSFRPSWSAGVGSAGDMSGLRFATPYGGQNSVVFNENSQNLDFRVESDIHSHMLFVDASQGRIGVNTSGPESTLCVNGDILAPWGNSGSVNIGIATRGSNLFSTGSKDLIIKGAGATSGGQAMQGGDVYVQGGVGAGNAGLGIYAGNLYLEGGSHTGGVGVESGAGKIFMKTAGYERLNISEYGHVTINEAGRNCDFRVESDGFTNAIEVDAGDNLVGFRGVSVAPWAQTSGDGRMTYRLTEGSMALTNNGTHGYAGLYINKFNASSDNRAISFYREGGTEGHIRLDATQGVKYGTSTNGGVTSTTELNKLGITFDGGSNYLDDYEEGTWDARPSTSQSSVVPLSGWNINAYSGSYVKIGRLVVCQYYFDWTNTNNNSSTVYLRLPFQVNGTTNHWSGNGTETSQVSFPSGATQITVRPENLQSYATFKGCGNNLNRVDMQFNHFGGYGAGYALGSFVYMTTA